MKITVWKNSVRVAMTPDELLNAAETLVSMAESFYDNEKAIYSDDKDPLIYIEFVKVSEDEWAYIDDIEEV